MSSDIKPGIFFSYFGGKYMRAPYYPAPQYQAIVEPFAGAAGYPSHRCPACIAGAKRDAEIKALRQRVEQLTEDHKP